MTENIFKKKFENNEWHSVESKSGKGSELEITTNIRKELPLLVKKYNIKSVLDVPCGDFNWMKEIIFKIPNYTGGDIVKELIEDNKKKYNNINFIQLNLIKDKIQNCDLLFIRDCLFHLSYEDIQKVIHNIQSSNIKYVLITNFHNHINKNIKTGGFRPLCFEKAPFHFKKPIQIIKENQQGLYKDKHMALWETKDILNFKF